MRNNYPYLNDSNFLKEIDSQHIKSYLVNVIVLDWYQQPIEKIQGRVVNANITIDGNSSIRRTCNLTLVADGIINDLTKVDNLISINKKVDIEIGYINTTNKYKEYPVIYFPLGTYVIINPNISHDADNVTISLQLKDKMCLLNGECGGTIPASTVFHEYYTIDDKGKQILTKPTIYQIIQELVNHFGGEQLGKIIISDIPDQVKQVVKWTGESPLYMVQKDNEYKMTTNIDQYYSLINSSYGWHDVDGSPFEYGYDVGFIFTDFTFPGDLICDGGASIVSILDKIVAVLGNFEYFYDLNGNFVFQQIKNYLNNSQSTTALDYLNQKGNIDPQSYLLDTSKGKTVYEFNDSNLIASYNNIPQYNMIKNDFMVWGIRKSSQGLEVPVRYHLAIDKKPEIGNTYWAFQYEDPKDHIKKWHCPISFATRSNFPSIGAEGVFYCSRNDNKIYTWAESNGSYTYILINATLQRVTTTDWRTELYFQGVSAQPFGTQSNYYYAELANEWPKIYDIKPDEYKNGQWINNSEFKQITIKSPVNIDFFLDFIDSDDKIAEFAVNNIGRRSFVKNDDSINCVFEPVIPDVILIKKDGSTITDSIGNTIIETDKIKEECQRRGQDYYEVPDGIYMNLASGGTFNSGYDLIRQILHQYTSYNESVSISCLPIYYLEPNTRIGIFDEDSNISGDYVISTINITLDTGSLMSINATRALERI